MDLTAIAMWLHPSMDFANKAVFIQCLEALRLKMCHSQEEQMEVEIKKRTTPFLEKTTVLTDGYVPEEMTNLLFYC